MERESNIFYTCSLNYFHKFTTFSITIFIIIIHKYVNNNFCQLQHLVKYCDVNTRAMADLSAKAKFFLSGKKREL